MFRLKMFNVKCYLVVFRSCREQKKKRRKTTCWNAADYNTEDISKKNRQIEWSIIFLHSDSGDGKQ